MAVFFVTAWSLKTVHVFWLHADHHDRPVCLAEQDHAAQHIHDARYAGDDCTLCACVLSVATLPAVFAWSELKLIIPAEQLLFDYQSPYVLSAIGVFASRGPPMA